jgi:hypothetical protein
MGKRIRKFLIRALAVMLILAAVLWTADWLLLRRKVAQTQDAFGEVKVHRRFAIHLKNKQIEERSEKPKMEECVNSMFPHYSESPCWYLQKHADQLIDLDGGAWHLFSE